MIEILVFLLFASWIICTVIQQFAAHSEKDNFIQKYDYFSLVPLWTFFAPNPGVTDYHLMYREVLNDESIRDWEEIALSDERTILAAFWNPQKRVKKTMSDSVQTIVELSEKLREDQTAIKLSIPYLCILNYLTFLPKNGEVARRQFLIFESFGFYEFQPERLILRSDAHRV